jgi:hypothetical protein
MAAAISAVNSPPPATAVLDAVREIIKIVNKRPSADGFGKAGAQVHSFRTQNEQAASRARTSVAGPPVQCSRISQHLK